MIFTERNGDIYWFNEVFGRPPKTTREPRVVPIPTLVFALNAKKQATHEVACLLKSI